MSTSRKESAGLFGALLLIAALCFVMAGIWIWVSTPLHPLFKIILSAIAGLGGYYTGVFGFKFLTKP